MNLAGNILLVGSGIVIFVAILCGCLSILWNILDIIQLFSYLKYLNVDFPQNMDEFFELFDFAQFNQYSSSLSASFFGGLEDYLIPEEY